MEIGLRSRSQRIIERKEDERAGIHQSQTVANRMGRPGMRSGDPRDGRSTHRVPSHVQRNRSRHPNPSPVGAASCFYVSGLAGRSGPGCGTPPWVNTSRVTGTALDPDCISGLGGHHGGERTGSYRDFFVLGPGCTRRILIPVLTCCGDRAVHDSLAGKAPGVTVIKLDY